MNKIILLFTATMITSSMIKAASGAGGTGIWVPQRAPTNKYSEVTAPDVGSDLITIGSDDESLKRYIGSDFVGWLHSKVRFTKSPSLNDLRKNIEANCPLIKDKISLQKFTEEVKNARQYKARLFIPRCYARESAPELGPNNTMYIDSDDESLKRYIGPDFVGWINGWGIKPEPALKEIMTNIAATCPVSFVKDKYGSFLVTKEATIDWLTNIVVDAREAGRAEIRIRHCYTRPKELAAKFEAREKAEAAAAASYKADQEKRKASEDARFYADQVKLTYKYSYRSAIILGKSESEAHAYAYRSVAEEFGTAAADAAKARADRAASGGNTAEAGAGAAATASAARTTVETDDMARGEGKYASELRRIRVLRRQLDETTDGSIKKMYAYQILGIDPTADKRTIRVKFLQLSRRYHPDKASGNKAAEEIFKIINAAHDILK